jgi:hypothetical protein
MRTAGQPALRRKIFSDGPGMTMPGAAHVRTIGTGRCGIPMSCT